MLFKTDPIPPLLPSSSAIPSDLSKQSNAVDTQKAAVLAALNIANELFQAEQTQTEMEKRTTDLLAIVESA